MKKITLNRWHARLAKAAALLDGRLDDPPSLKELATAAAVSPFHFHRIWRALTGETIGQTVLRLRIQVSKDMLAAADSSVSQTAMAMGYGTPQSFARAFRRQTGVSPSRLPRSKSSASIPSSQEMGVHIEQRGSVLVVALRREGAPYSNLNATFGQIWTWAKGAGLLSRIDGIYGIPLDDPQSVPSAQLRYQACFAMGEDVDPPKPFETVSLPKGSYACARHLGSYEALEDSTQQMIEQWLLRSGREPADFPLFYQFLNDPDETPPEALITDILIPIL